MADLQDRYYNIDLVTNSIELVNKWLQATWKMYYPEDKRLTGSVVRNVSDLRSFAADNPGLEYPTAQLTIVSIGPDPEKGGLSKKFIPVVTGRTENSERIVVANNIPVRIGLGLTVRTDSLDDIVKLAYILVFAAPKISLKVQNDSGFVFENGLQIDPELTIPNADLGTPSKEYLFETTLILSTWMTRERVQGVIRQVRFEVVDSGGISIPLGDFPTFDALVDSKLTYTEIVDKDSVHYKHDRSS